MDANDTIQWLVIFILILAFGGLVWMVLKTDDKVDNHRHSPGDGRLMDRDGKPLK